MRGIVVISVASMALFACSKPAATNQATQASDSTPASGPAVGPPHRRAGLWQTSVTVDGHASPMSTMKLCVDAAMDAKTSALHPNVPVTLGHSTHCAYPTPTRGPDGAYSFSVTCPLSGGGQTVTHGSAGGDWSSAYHVHIDTVTTGAPIAVANGHHVTDMEGKWLGPCPEGMAGGDMELANGMKISGGKLAGAAAMVRGMAGGGAPNSGQ